MACGDAYSGDPKRSEGPRRAFAGCLPEQVERGGLIPRPPVLSLVCFSILPSPRNTKLRSSVYQKKLKSSGNFAPPKSPRSFTAI
jgi:hypothetical protein